jgi:branched-chain amino acid transport system ATP-binding protein
VSALKVDNLMVRIGPQEILRGVSILAAAESITCILGANGAGKTTLMRTISGIYPVSGGSIEFQGVNIVGRPSHEISRIGLAHAPEGRHLFHSMTVLENLRVGGMRLKHGEFAETYDQVTVLFPLVKARANQRAGSLSGGEQQMVCLARSLMSRPKLLLLDEPSLGLAPIVVAQIFELIGLIRAQGTAVLMVEQNVHAALHIADSAYVLEGGQIVLEGAAKDLLNDERITSAYLGGHVRQSA